ncbi:hypothetical protein ACR6C2_32425 [Streptomyces sp. INA 01156]
MSTRVIVASSREDTSRSPSARGARPQGVFRSSVTVRSTFTEPFAGGVSSAPRSAGEDCPVARLDGLSPPSGAPPSPEEHPAVSRSAAASTAVTAR